MSTVIKPEQRYLSLRQAAILADLSVRTIRRAIDAGRLTAYRIGRVIRVPHSEFIAYVQQRRVANP